MVQMILKNVLQQFKKLSPAALCSALLQGFLVSLSELAKKMCTNNKVSSGHNLV